MCQCNIRNEGGFSNWDDFDKFSVQIANSNFKKIPVKESYSDFGFIEMWFQCNQCGSIWRLVEPDPPFKGNWSRVTFLQQGK